MCCIGKTQEEEQFTPTKSKVCKTKNYKGIYPPKCKNGEGCDLCWNIWANRLRRLVDPPKFDLIQWDQALREVYAPAIKQSLESSTQLLHLFE